jgi:hypothetical protein
MRRAADRTHTAAPTLAAWRTESRRAMPSFAMISAPRADTYRRDPAGT